MMGISNKKILYSTILLPTLIGVVTSVTDLNAEDAKINDDGVIQTELSKDEETVNITANDVSINMDNVNTF